MLRRTAARLSRTDLLSIKWLSSFKTFMTLIIFKEKRIHLFSLNYIVMSTFLLFNWLDYSFVLKWKYLKSTQIIIWGSQGHCAGPAPWGLLHPQQLDVYHIIILMIEEMKAFLSSWRSWWRQQLKVQNINKSRLRWHTLNELLDAQNADVSHFLKYKGKGRTSGIWLEPSDFFFHLLFFLFEVVVLDKICAVSVAFLFLFIFKSVFRLQVLLQHPMLKFSHFQQLWTLMKTFLSSRWRGHHFTKMTNVVKMKTLLRLKTRIKKHQLTRWFRSSPFCLIMVCSSL